MDQTYEELEQTYLKAVESLSGRDHKIEELETRVNKLKGEIKELRDEIKSDEEEIFWLREEVERQKHHSARYYDMLPDNIGYVKCSYCDEYWMEADDDGPEICACGTLCVCSACAAEDHNHTKCAEFAE